MTTDTSGASVLRRVLPWVAAAAAVQLTAVVSGRALAARRDRGDEDSPEIVRYRTMAGLDLAPRSQRLRQVTLVLGWAGGELDLTGASPAPGGVDLQLIALFGGMQVVVPESWRVVWDVVGVGGVGGVDQCVDPAAAELRVHARVLFGGAGVVRGSAGRREPAGG